MQRLQTRRQFQAALDGVTLARTPHFALHCVTFEVAHGSAPALFVPQAVWLGAMVPKRWAKRAVTRNTIKRQIYTVSQTFESALTCAAHVVRLRSGFARTHFASASSAALKTAVRLELQELFGKVVCAPLAGPSVLGT